MSCPQKQLHINTHEGGGKRSATSSYVAARLLPREATVVTKPGVKTMLDLQILLSNVLIHLKQSCSLIKDLQVCLKDPPQNFVGFEGSKMSIVLGFKDLF
jgi:hypothetical protein